MRQMLALSLSLIIALSAAASVIDHERMYSFFLADDLMKWGPEITGYSQMKNLTLDDKLELCNYLYGFLSVAVEKEGKEVVERWFSLWIQYLSELEKAGTALSTTLVYRSALAAYKTMLYPGKAVTYAVQSMKLVDQALEADAENPLAVGLKGNMKFYTPAIIGGSKREAVEYYSRAVAILEHECLPVYRWNYTALQLCLVEGYEKTNQLDKAIALARKCLAANPDYVVMRDTVLPRLLKSRK